VTDGVAVRVLEILGIDLNNLKQEVLNAIAYMNVPITRTGNISSDEEDLSNSPPDFTSGEISARFCAFLFDWVEPRKLGHIVGSNGGFQLPNGEIVAPHISFFSHERLKRVPRIYPELAPELAVEIKSAFDRLASLQQKIQRFLQLGIRVALLVDPDTQTVSIYRLNRGVTIVGDKEKLTLPELFPGWELDISQLWPHAFN
jgi:Uma2 family endonuclease